MAPRTVTDDQVVDLITRTLEGPPPEAATQWSTRTMAEDIGLSKATISRIHALVLSLDEKSQVQALDRHPPDPPHGTGTVIGRCYRGRHHKAHSSWDVRERARVGSDD